MGAFSLQPGLQDGQLDDVQEQRELSTHILSGLGYRVAVATGGREAIEYLKEHTVDLLLLDMIMEDGFDGLDTYRAAAGRCQPGADDPCRHFTAAASAVHRDCAANSSKELRYVRQRRLAGFQLALEHHRCGSAPRYCDPVGRIGDAIGCVQHVHRLE